VLKICRIESIAEMVWSMDGQDLPSKAFRKQTLAIHLTMAQGDILVFMTGESLLQPLENILATFFHFLNPQMQSLHSLGRAQPCWVGRKGQE